MHKIYENKGVFDLETQLPIAIYSTIISTIYWNTQIHLLKDTLMSFGLSLLIPFVIYLLPGIFRIPALYSRSNKRECLYNFSKLLQSFWIYIHI